MMRYLLMSCFLALLIPPSYAFFCPTNFSQIDLGNTVEQVISACGKPDKQETKEQKAEGPKEWSYFIPQPVSTSQAVTTQGTLRTQIAFDANGKVLNLSVNGIGVGSTTICGQPIQLGDDEKKVKAACGEPTMINQQENTQTSKEPSTAVTTLTYNSNPPVKLIFENGKLKRKE